MCPIVEWWDPVSVPGVEPFYELRQAMWVKRSYWLWRSMTGVSEKHIPVVITQELTLDKSR